ncbi:MAG: substrate-binding domain-containing protein [Syntrophobacterales bacterium]|nr:substrate-binding domain-containing protein [Syntrophobacterales bacterium]
MIRKLSCSQSILLFFSLAMMTLLLTGCGQSNSQATSGVGQPKGTVRVSGAWALYPMMVRWAEEFNKTYPHVRIDISAGGAGKGAADALAGLTDIGMVSREVKPEEIKQGGFHVAVVKDAVFPTISAKNPVAKEILERKGIRKEAFVDLWVLGKAATWSEVAGGAPSGDRAQVYTRSDSCGAAETWAAYLGGRNQEDLKGVGVYGDPGIADAVRKDPLAIGFNNLNYAYDAKTGLPVKGLQVPPIDTNGNGRVDPEEDLSTKEKAIKAVTSGIYPSPPARDLNLIAKERFKEPAKTFVKWILTNGQKYVDEVGYIRLSEPRIKEMLNKIE